MANMLDAIIIVAGGILQIPAVEEARKLKIPCFGVIGDLILNFWKQITYRWANWNGISANLINLMH